MVHGIRHTGRQKNVPDSKIKHKILGKCYFSLFTFPSGFCTMWPLTAKGRAVTKGSSNASLISALVFNFYLN